jgi:predicted metal-dependent hydrolase
MIRKLTFKNRQIEYKIRISNKARRVSINIKNGFIILVVPSDFPVKKAEEFIRSKGDWILKHVDSARPKIEGLVYRGREMEPEYDDNTVTFVVKKNGKKIKIDDKLKFFFENWMYSVAQDYIPYRTYELADKYNFNFNKISVKQVRSRWGSCSSNGNLAFNYKLMQFENEVIDYVIVHELCHTKEMNHSPRFWKLVEDIIPNYKELKNSLKFGEIAF